MVKTTAILCSLENFFNVLEMLTMSVDVEAKLLALVRTGIAAVVPSAAIAGDIKTLRNHLEKNPDEVCQHAY